MDFRIQRFFRSVFVPGLLCLVCACALQSADKPPAPAPVEEVVVSGGISQAEVQVSENLTFWLTVRNKGSVPITDLRLHRLDPAGYEVARVCWISSGQENCWTPAHPAYQPASGAALPEQIQVAPKLSPGQSIAFWGTLRAARALDRQMVSAVLGWSIRDKPSSQVVAELGQCEVHSCCGWWWIQIRESLKDFAWPLVLAGVGFYFQWKFKKIEADRRKQGEYLAQLVQTWNNMLPKSHDLATNYYMRIAGYLELTIGSIQVVQGLLQTEQGTDEKRQALNEKKRYAFFAFMSLRRALRKLSIQRGGFYFKNRGGELLAGHFLNEFRKSYERGDDDIKKNLSAMLPHIKVNELYADFVAKLEGKSPATQAAPGGASQPTPKEIGELFQAGLKHFDNWLTTNMKNAKVDWLCQLEAFRRILKYEMNRPYQYWYGVEEKLKLDKHVKSLIVEAAKELEQAGELQGSIEDYLKAEVT